MHTTSPILNSFILYCYHLNQWQIFKQLFRTETWKPSLNCPLNTPYPNPWECPIDSIPKCVMICSLIFHFRCHHLGSGHDHLFARMLVSTDLFCLFYSTLYSVATEVYLKSESHHDLTPHHQLPHHQMHIRMHWKSFSICPLYAQNIGLQKGKEFTLEHKYKAAHSFFHWASLAKHVCLYVCLWGQGGCISSVKCSRWHNWYTSAQALFLSQMGRSLPASNPCSDLKLSSLGFPTPNNEAPACLSSLILSPASFYSSAPTTMHSFWLLDITMWS